MVSGADEGKEDMGLNGPFENTLRTSSRAFRSSPGRDPFDASSVKRVFYLVSSGRSAGVKPTLDHSGKGEVTGVCSHDSSVWNVGFEPTLDHFDKSEVAGPARAISLSSLTPSSTSALGPFFGEQFFVVLGSVSSTRERWFSFLLTRPVLHSTVLARSSRVCAHVEDLDPSDCFWPVSLRLLR